MQIKKGRPKSPELPCVPCEPEGSALLALVRILPDEVTNAPEERDHQKNGADSRENHCIDEHGLPPVVPVCLGWLHVISTGGGKIDLDQWLESRRDQALGNTDPGQEIGGYGARSTTWQLCLTRKRREFQRFLGLLLDFFLPLPSGNTCSNT